MITLLNIITFILVHKMLIMTNDDIGTYQYLILFTTEQKNYRVYWWRQMSFLLPSREYLLFFIIQALLISSAAMIKMTFGTLKSFLFNYYLGYLGS